MFDVSQRRLCICRLVYNLACTFQGNLNKQIADEGGKMTERQAVQKVVQPCLTALAELHAKSIAHGAILPHNILFTSLESTCKLAGMQP